MPTAVITGGTTGIGRATAELLHARGHQVAVTGQNPESLARAQSELPGDVLVVRSDGRVLSDTDALMSAVSERFGSLDMPFLNAGIFRPAPVAEVTEESFDEHADLNFKGQYFTLQKALPLMNDGGSIVLGVPESGRDAMRSKIPFERFGSSREVAEAVAFLASDAAGHITGQDIAVAGGHGLGA
ncbi:SDR family oxidoreductase [Streptomyces bauhiniae]